MKHLMKLLFVPFLLFFSCTTQVDGVLNDGDLSQNNEDASVEATLHPVGISFSKSSIAAFAEEGISEIGIYVYMDGSLIYGEKQPLVHASLQEIAENDYNLNIPRYVDTFEEEEPIDIKAVMAEIKELEAKRAELDKEIEGYLKELGLVE